MLIHGTFLRQVFKAVIALASFAVPAFFASMPEVANLTVGALVYGALSWLETKVN